MARQVIIERRDESDSAFIGVLVALAVILMIAIATYLYNNDYAIMSPAPEPMATQQSTPNYSTNVTVEYPDETVQSSPTAETPASPEVTR